jgi:hypothetical protein
MQISDLNIQYSDLNIQYSIFDIQYLDIHICNIIYKYSIYKFIYIEAGGGSS